MMGRNNFDLNILVLVSSFVSFFFLLKGHSFLCPSVMIEGIHFKFPVYDIKKNCNANGAFFLLQTFGYCTSYHYDPGSNNN